MKEIDLTRSLYELAQEHPEVVEIMWSLGFQAIKKPGMLQTAGRYMTIPKGAQLKKIPLEQVLEAFKAQGFNVKGGTQ